MQRDLRKYLTDIDIHIDYIDEFLKGERDFAVYAKIPFSMPSNARWV